MDLDWNFTELPPEPRSEIRSGKKQEANEATRTEMEWARLRGRLLNVLKNFPDAHRAVLEVFTQPEPAT